MESEVRKLFERYENFFKHALATDLDKQEIADLYTSEFIAASPAGVMTGKNDDKFVHSMLQGYRHYRKIGTQKMTIRGLSISQMDDLHCVARVSWTATYARNDLPEISLNFDVYYLVQYLGGHAKIFGWVSGDEQALLKQNGII